MTKHKISPVIRSKAEARKNYNRLSRWYDTLAGSTEAKYRQMGMALLALQPGERVLEIGCGTGHCLVEFARIAGSDGLVCGIDLSDGMIAQARNRAAVAGLADRVNLALADAVQTPFGEACCDAVFMSFTLELFDTPEIPQVLQSCQRILRPGGRLVLVTMSKAEKPGLPERIYEWFHARMPVAVDCRPIFAQTALREAGFSLTQVKSETMWGLPVEIILAGKATTP